MLGKQVRSCTDCIHFQFEVRTILDHGQAKKLRGYWCEHKVANAHRHLDGYGACRAEKPEALHWKEDPSKRRFWNQYARRLR